MKYGAVGIQYVLPHTRVIGLSNAEAVRIASLEFYSIKRWHTLQGDYLAQAFRAVITAASRPRAEAGD